MVVINSFTDDHAFLSNFYRLQPHHPLHPTLEHSYQAGKTLDEGRIEMILSATTPGKAKRLGGDRKKTILREDWEKVKISFMRNLVALKFSAPRMALALLGTGDAYLIEGNNWCDCFWGSCSCHDCRGREKHNNLGKILMQVRAELRSLADEDPGSSIVINDEED